MACYGSVINFSGERVQTEEASVKMKSAREAGYDAHRIGVGGICRYRNKILLVKIGYGPSEGKWILPGGLVEFGEKLSEAVEREVLEETGVQTKAEEIVSVRHMISQRNREGKKSDLYITFRVKYVNGEPTAHNREVSAAEFVTIKQLKNRKLGELVRHIIDKTASIRGIHISKYKPTCPIEKKLGVHKYELYV